MVDKRFLDGAVAAFVAGIRLRMCADMRNEGASRSEA